MNHLKFPKVFLWLAAILAIGTVYWISRSVFQLDVKEVRSWILSFGIAAPLIYIAVYTVRPLVFFPASILSIAGGLAFGPWMGTFYTIIGASLGAMLSFMAAKKIRYKFRQKRMAGKYEGNPIADGAQWFFLRIGIAPISRIQL